MQGRINLYDLDSLSPCYPLKNLSHMEIHISMKMTRRKENVGARAPTEPVVRQQEGVYQEQYPHLASFPPAAFFYAFPSQ